MRTSFKTFVKVAACGMALAAASLPAHAQFGNFLQNLPSLPIPGIGNGNSGSKPLTPDTLLEKAQSVQKAFKEPTVEEEIDSGKEAAAVLLGAKPLDPDARLQRYVNNLGRWLALQTERPDLPWTFGVLADSGFNAFATPGGTIFVTRGLVDRVRNESELAGVLAHEIGHVLRKHHLAAIQNNSRLGLAVDVAEYKSGANPQLKSIVASAFKKLYASGLDQSDEYEADRLGVVIAARAGYDPYGLPSVLQMLESHSGSEGAFSLLFKTHPSPAARIQELDQRMGGSLDGLRVIQGKAVAARLPEFAK